MTDHLEEARYAVKRGDEAYDEQKHDSVHSNSQLATAHALIALVERLDKLTITNKDFMGKDVSHLRVNPYTTDVEF